MRSYGIRVDSNSVTGVLVREKFGYRGMQRNCHVKRKAGIGVMLPQAKKHQGFLAATWREARNRVSLCSEPPSRNQFCQHLDFGPLVSWTVREEILMWWPCIGGLCNGSYRKLIPTPSLLFFCLHEFPELDPKGRKTYFSPSVVSTTLRRRKMWPLWSPFWWAHRPKPGKCPVFRNKLERLGEVRSALRHRASHQGMHTLEAKTRWSSSKKPRKRYVCQVSQPNW